MIWISKCLPTFVFVSHLPDSHCDLIRARESSGLARRRGDDLLEFALGGRQKLLALSRPIGSQERIATDDQSLARIVLRSDFCEIDFIEQGPLHGSLIQEPSDRRCA